MRSSNAVILTSVACALQLSAMLWRSVRSRTKLFYRNTSSNRALVDKLAILRNYKPTFWLNGGLFPNWSGWSHTIFATLFRSIPKNFGLYDRELISFDDGGQVALDWRGKKHGYPTLIILHGLTGGSDDAYVKWLVRETESKGNMQCVVFNARGCGDTELTSAKGFTASDTTDLAAVIKHIKTVVGDDTPLYGVGFSLGAGVLTKFVGEQGDDCPLTAAVALCPSLDFHFSTALMEEPFNLAVMNGRLTRNLIGYMKKNEAAISACKALDLEHVYASRSLREFDTRVIVGSGMFGYESVEDYYSDASPGRVLHRVRRPLLLLVAEDDPVCSSRGVQLQTVVDNPHLLLALTDEGGHVAWGSGMLPWGSSWMEQAAVEFLLNHVAPHHHSSPTTH